MQNACGVIHVCMYLSRCKPSKILPKLAPCRAGLEDYRHDLSDAENNELLKEFKDYFEKSNSTANFNFPSSQLMRLCNTQRLFFLDLLGFSIILHTTSSLFDWSKAQYTDFSILPPRGFL